MWTREEALSRACKAGLHEHPEALREALHKHKHKLDDVSAAAQSLTVGGLVEALAATGAKIAAYAQDKVAALLPSLADPFLAASNAGAHCDDAVHTRDRGVQGSAGPHGLRALVDQGRRAGAWLAGGRPRDA